MRYNIKWLCAEFITEIIMRNLLYVLLISMVPFIEIRGSVPVGAALGLSFFECFTVSVIGNMLPVPFILLFIKKILAWMKKVPKLEKIAVWVEAHGAKRSDKVTRYATLGLALFVGIPLPGTGAWTGSLIASLLDMKFGYAIVSVFCGVLIAGFIMSGISYGFLGFLSFLS